MFIIIEKNTVIELNSILNTVINLRKQIYGYLYTEKSDSRLNFFFLKDATIE